VQGLLDYPVMDAGYLFIPRGIAAGLSMVLTGTVLVRMFDQRLLVAIGLIVTGTGNLALSWLDLSAGFWDLALPGVISGFGMGLFFVPMSTLAFQNISRSKQDEAFGIYGVMRSIGSSVGIAVAGWQLAIRVQEHWNSLSAGITPFDSAVAAYLRPVQLESGSKATAIERLASEVARQAQMLAFQDMFFLTAMAAFMMLPLLLLLQRPPSGAASTPSP
jgi:DHA2 family multidrug resistance protein